MNSNIFPNHFCIILMKDGPYPNFMFGPSFVTIYTQFEKNCIDCFIIQLNSLSCNKSPMEQKKPHGPHKHYC